MSWQTFNTFFSQEQQGRVRLILQKHFKKHKIDIYCIVL